MKRENYQSGVKWEKIVGYSRAVRIGNRILVSGTTATNSDGEIVGSKNPYLQTKQCILNIQQALSNFDSELSSVVRTRMYVTNIDNWEEFGRAHAEFFDMINPVTSMVEVKRLINPEMLIEMEAEAVIIDGNTEK